MSNIATHVMLDLMSTIRLMSLGKFPNYERCHMRHNHVSLSHVSDIIHIVLDSYIEMSLKEGVEYGVLNQQSALTLCA